MIGQTLNGRRFARKETRGHGRWLLAVPVIVALLLLAGLNPGRLQDWFSGRGRIEALAVLPLANLSGDPQQDFFSDGITQGLIASLHNISALQCRSWDSVRQYKEKKRPLYGIARELNVEAVLEGSVRKVGDRVRITVQLSDAKANRLWGENHEREANDILTLQSEVAQAIVREIRIAITPQEKTRLAGARPISPAAYEAFLTGRAYCSTRTEDMKKGIAELEKALAIEPNYAPAYAELATLYAEMSSNGYMSRDEAYPGAKGNALKALKLDSQRAEVHLALGHVKGRFEWNLAGAETSFKQALALNPGNTKILIAYSWCLTGLRRFEESINMSRRAVELEPNTMLPSLTLGWSRIAARKYDQAIEILRRAEQLDPASALPNMYLSWCYVKKGMLREGVAQAYSSLKKIGKDENQVALASAGWVYASAGQRDQALYYLELLLETRKRRYIDAYNIAPIYLALGDRGGALEWLETGFRERSPIIWQAAFDIWWDDIASDSRFQDLLRRIREVGVENHRHQEPTQ